jgi:predicted transposase YdaD
MKTDKLLYRLLQDHPELVFQLAGLPVPEAEYELRAEEVKEIQFRLDGLLVPAQVGPDSPLVFLENQFQIDGDFWGRWFASVHLRLRLHPEQRHWRAVALFPSRAMDVGDPLGYEELLASGRVVRVYLDDWLAAPDPPPGVGLVRLLLAQPEAALDQARALLASPAPTWRDFADWVETLLIYKLPRLTREEIRAMLHTLDIDLSHTVFYQEVFAEGKGEGLEEGRQEGRHEGRQEGRQEGEAKVLAKLLSRRFGSLLAGQEAAILALPQRELDALADVVLDLADTDDLAAWLTRRGALGKNGASG